jgi:hypothetical protein
MKRIGQQIEGDLEAAVGDFVGDLTHVEEEEEEAVGELQMRDWKVISHIDIRGEAKFNGYKLGIGVGLEFIWALNFWQNFDYFGFGFIEVRC